MEVQDKEQPLTLQNLVQMHNQLSELYQNNLNLRMKYPTEPLKFYQSEEQIDNLLQQLQQVTQQQMPIIVESKILVPILKLLNHPNADINMSCIQFLHEIITQEPGEDQVYEIYYRACIWMIQNQLFQNLVETLAKMKEEESAEEYEISLKILKIIETLTELWDSSVETLVKDTKILDYLANRVMPNYVVKHKVIDDNKFVGSDILAFILANSLQAQLKFHQLFGMQILIESIRPYLSKIPASSDQKQYLGNLFDCLNILMINPTEDLAKSRTIYHQMKGNQVMIEFIKKKNEQSVSALKAIANSYNNVTLQDESRISEDLIQFGALKYLFPIVQRQGLKGADVDEQKEIDENCLQVLYLMIRSTTQLYRLRVEGKLSEKRYAKLQKIFEIRNEYMQNIGVEAEKQVAAAEYLDRLKEGLGVVQIIDKILCCLSVSESAVKQKLPVLMKLYGVSLQNVQMVLQTAYKYMGQVPQKSYLQKILSENVRILAHSFQKVEKQIQQK